MADDKVKWKKLTEIYGNARLREHLLVLHNLGVPEGVILKKAPYAKNVADRWIDNIRRRQAARSAGGGGGGGGDGDGMGVDGGGGGGGRSIPPTPIKDNKRQRTGK